MAIWRDPLDELIEDLEKAIPETQRPNRARPVRAGGHAGGDLSDPQL
jgi:hypothetical protein